MGEGDTIWAGGQVVPTWPVFTTYSELARQPLVSILRGYTSQANLRLPMPKHPEKAQRPTALHRQRIQPTRRSGEVSLLAALSIVSLLLLSMLSYALLRASKSQVTNSENSSRIIKVYCAAGAATPTEKAVQSFNDQSPNTVAQVTRTGGSGTLFGQLKSESLAGIEQGADVFISADWNLLQRGQGESVIGAIFPLGRQQPVIAVRIKDDDPKSQNINLKTLVQSQGAIRFGIANQHAAIGKVTWQIAQQSGMLEQLLLYRKMESENVMQLAQALSSGTVDAAIVWDTTVIQINRDQPTLRIASRLPVNPANNVGRIGAGIIRTSQSPQSANRALEFAKFLADEYGGAPAFAKAGFAAIHQGDGAIRRSEPVE